MTYVVDDWGYEQYICPHCDWDAMTFLGVVDGLSEFECSNCGAKMRWQETDEERAERAAYWAAHPRPTAPSAPE